MSATRGSSEKSSRPTSGFFAETRFSSPQGSWGMAVFALERTVTSILTADGDLPVEPQQHTIALPFAMCWASTAKAARTCARQLGASPGAVEGPSMPMHSAFSETATVSLSGDRLTITARGREFLVREVPGLFATFLRLTGNLGVHIKRPRVDGTSEDYYATLRLEGAEEHHLPQVARLTGRFSRRLVEQAKGWVAMTPLAGGVMNDWQGDREDLTYQYASGKTVRFIPNKVVKPECARCGTKGDLTWEHCTPDWLAERLGVAPVKAQLLCGACNSRFGALLEAPVSEIHARGELLRPEFRGLVARWAVKTATLLAAASNVDVPSSLFEFVDGSGGDPKIAVHVAANEIPLEDGGYAYGITHFRSKRAGLFLLVMVFDRIGFMVSRSEPALGQLPIERWIPSFLPGKGFVPYDTTFQDWVLQEHFDIHLINSPGRTRSAQPRGERPERRP